MCDTHTRKRQELRRARPETKDLSSTEFGLVPCNPSRMGTQAEEAREDMLGAGFTARTPDVKERAGNAYYANLTISH